MSNSAKTRLLFVDEDENTLSGLRAVLRSMRKEWKPCFASTAREGLEILEKEPVDVVVADTRLPGMSGAEFLQRASEIRPAAARIVLSGDPEVSTVLKSVKTAHRFLTKPLASHKLILALKQVVELRGLFANQEVRAVVGRMDSLPALPDSFMKIVDELGSPEPSLKRIGRFVERDATISASLLKVVNSSFFGFYKEVKSPAHAVTLLGTDILKGLVLGVGLIKTFEPSGDVGESLKNLWNHSLWTASVAKALAKYQGAGREIAEKVFTSGLLHDLGKLVLATQLEPEYEEVVDLAGRDGLLVVNAEYEVFRTTHAEVGAYLLGLWNFDPLIVRAVAAHHAPAGSGGGMSMALAVHVANALVHEMDPDEPSPDKPRLDMEWIEAQGMDEDMDHWRAVCFNQLQGSDHREA